MKKAYTNCNKRRRRIRAYGTKPGWTFCYHDCHIVYNVSKKYARQQGKKLIQEQLI